MSVYIVVWCVSMYVVVWCVSMYVVVWCVFVYVVVWCVSVFVVVWCVSVYVVVWCVCMCSIVYIYLDPMYTLICTVLTCILWMYVCICSQLPTHFNPCMDDTGVGGDVLHLCI